MHAIVVFFEDEKIDLKTWKFCEDFSDKFTREELMLSSDYIMLNIATLCTMSTL